MRSPPVSIVGDYVEIIGGQYLNTQQNTSAFVVQSSSVLSSTGIATLKISDMDLIREQGVGATAEQPMITVNPTGNSAFRVVLSDTRSEEWPWGLAGSNVRLVEGGITVYKNHQLHITATDPNVYNLNTPVDSELPPFSAQFDQFGYSGQLPGWQLITSASGSTMSQGTAAGPPGFLPVQIHLHATGQAQAVVANTLFLSVRPGELYWVSAWAQINTGASGSIGALFENTGGLDSFVNVADQVGIGLGVWTFVEGPVIVPAEASFMGVGGQMTAAGDLFITDIRVRRAS
jgi:hypothetical protein